MLVMKNRKMSHMSSFLTRSTLPYGRNKVKRSFIERHVFIKRAMKAQEVRWDREHGLMEGGGLDIPEKVVFGFRVKAGVFMSTEQGWGFHHLDSNTLYGQYPGDT